MKKILCALICVIFLCGCEGAAAPKAVNRNISYRAHIFYYGKEYDCFVVIDGDGRAEYKINDGLLEGFTATYFGDSITLSYAEKENPQPYSYPKGNMLSVLYELNESLSGEYKTEKKDGQYVVLSETTLGEYTLFISGAGLPLSAKLDDEEFYVEFYDVSLINQG